jgi:hypothetical protein
MSTTVRLIHNAIIAGRWYGEGEPIEENLVPENLRKYIAKPTSKSPKRGLPQLNYELNHRYSVDADGFLRDSPAQQASQMEAIEDELAEPLSETLASAIEQAREDHRANVQRQKVEAQAKVRRQDEAAEFARQEQNEDLESGEFDQFESRPAELTRTQPATESLEREAARGASANRKLKVKGKRSFVRRGKRFLPASSLEDLIEGEVLYRHRPKSFGIAEKYIAFGKVIRKETE